MDRENKVKLPEVSSVEKKKKGWMIWLRQFKFSRKKVDGGVIDRENNVKLPKFDGDNLFTFVFKLKKWMLVTAVKKKKQGLMIWLLPRNDPRNIKRFIIDNIGMEGLANDDCIDKIIKVIRVISMWEGFDRDFKYSSKKVDSEVH